jgi:glycosyltransferase involved in cell wall biosynthesis
MTVVAYLSNLFPSAVEPYVAAEIAELRARGVQVVVTSARQPGEEFEKPASKSKSETLYLLPLRVGASIRATAYLLSKLPAIAEFIIAALFAGRESPGKRMRTLAHTWLGAYYALALRSKRVQHIHVHHGYFSCWVAMVAARLLGITYSMTLHGSDVLLHADYMETKLRHCKFCLTVSEFNKQYILRIWPEASGKVGVCLLGVEVPARGASRIQTATNHEFTMLAVGRLHPVKDHEFLVRGCRELKIQGMPFICRIAGDGPEHGRLQSLIGELGLQANVALLGHLTSAELEPCYANADLVVLTSRSEGIPLVLMEAMALGKIVLAPAITGIPELVTDGVTGFLYRPGCMKDWLAKIQTIVHSGQAASAIGAAARQHVSLHFNRTKRLSEFGDIFLARIAHGAAIQEIKDENSVLQQVQLPI